VDFGKILGFGGIIDDAGGPDRLSGFVKSKAAAENVFEKLENFAALENFFIAGGNDVMFDFKIELPAVVVDALKPVFDAFEIFDVFSCFGQIFSGKGDAFRGLFLQSSTWNL
ncbi:MAG: hypothetical protein Q4F75_08925, partial [Pseudomonadota bacterium]|nr:hypothetical protein [Pseudomonadota bacterium]